MDKGGKRTISLVGASSLLVIFSVLCLVIFALLSLSTARADQRLSQRSAQSVLDYYEADRTAQGILARLREGQLPQGVTEEDGVYSYSCPISDTQALMVSVRLSQAGYTILRWQAVSTTDWQPDLTLELWNGETN